MSKYLRQYADKQAYKDDTTRPTDRSSVSVAGNGVEYDGKNVIVPYRSALLEMGDEKLYDLAEHCEVILKHGTFNAATFDSARYVRSEAFYLLSYADRDIFVYKKCIGDKANTYHGGAVDGSEQWAANNEYKVTCDLTEDGGFSYTCTPYSSAISGSCSWTAGATIASVVSQLTTGSGLSVKAIGDNAISFTLSTYNNGVITFSNTSHATVLDCSLSARIGINGTPKGSHAGFQGQAVKTIFPTLEFMTASSVCYCESGNNSSYRTNIKPDTFKSWATSSGAATFKAESELEPMKKSVWDALATDEDASHKALYDKYGGDYDKYLLSAICAAFGITVDGETTGFGPGNWYMNSCTELVEELTPEHVTILNAAIATATNGQAIQYRAQWAVGEFNGNYAWLYYPTNGALNNYNKYSSFQVRPLLASKRV